MPAFPLYSIIVSKILNISYITNNEHEYTFKRIKLIYELYITGTDNKVSDILSMVSTFQLRKFSDCIVTIVAINLTFCSLLTKNDRLFCVVAMKLKLIVPSSDINLIMINLLQTDNKFLSNYFK